MKGIYENFYTFPNTSSFVIINASVIAYLILEIIVFVTCNQHTSLILCATICVENFKMYKIFVDFMVTSDP